MIPVKQKIHNDCFRACMASVLELPNSDILPHITSEKWHIEWKNLLAQFGLTVTFGIRDAFPDGYWLASVKSKNYNNTLHSIVMDGNRIAFDPNLKNVYKTGDILPKESIHDYCWIEVIDISKLHELDNYREYLIIQEDTKQNG